MGEKDAVVSNLQLSDGFLNGFHACEEPPKVENAATSSETDRNAVWQVLFCFSEHDAEEAGEQCGGQNAPLVDAIGDREAVQQ